MLNHIFYQLKFRICANDINNNKNKYWFKVNFIYIVNKIDIFWHFIIINELRKFLMFAK